MHIAIIGAGGRGAANLKGVEGENIVALCDVNSTAVGAAAAKHTKAAKFTDFRQLFDKAAKTFDAVVVSTCEHTHAFATLRALEAEDAESHGDVAELLRGIDHVAHLPIFGNLIETRRGTDELIPGLATSWTVSPDGRTYTFQLRDDVSFCSGKKMTSQDVVYSFKRLKDPEVKAPFGWRAGEIKELRATGPYTVEYELKGINQIAVRADIGLTFAVGLRHILRQDPNVIMVGEIRDLLEDRLRVLVAREQPLEVQHREAAEAAHLDRSGR